MHALSANVIRLMISVVMTLVLPRILGVEEYSYWQLYLFYVTYTAYSSIGWCEGTYLKYGGMEYAKLDLVSYTHLNNYKRLNADNKKGLADYVRGDIGKKDMIYKTNWPLLDYIPCGTINGENPLHLLYASKMAEVMEILEKKYDFVLIDVPVSYTHLDVYKRQTFSWLIV